VDGYYWWYFAYPTLADTSLKTTNGPIPDFEAAAGGSVNFGGEVGAMKVHGLSHSTWNDPAATNTWSALWTVVTPTPAPLGAVSSPFSSATNSFAFTVPVPSNAPNGTPAANPVTVNLTTTSGSATLVYQVDRQNGVITVTPQDISNPTTLTAVGNALVATPTATPVKVFGVPQANGSITAYELFYYTHTASAK
jgi:hypothetical protein